MTPQELINEANCNRAIPSPQPLADFLPTIPEYLRGAMGMIMGAFPYESNLASETAQALRVLAVIVAILEEGQADG